MRRGEIWTAASSGPYARKPRPVVIIQNDDFDATDSVSVCIFTSDPTDAFDIRLLFEPTEVNGLNAPSRLMIDKIMTVRRSSLGHRLGALDPNDMARVDEALLLFLGLAA